MLCRAQYAGMCCNCHCQLLQVASFGDAMQSPGKHIELLCTGLQGMCCARVPARKFGHAASTSSMSASSHHALVGQLQGLSQCDVYAWCHTDVSMDACLLSHAIVCLGHHGIWTHHSVCGCPQTLWHQASPEGRVGGCGLEAHPHHTTQMQRCSACLLLSAGAPELTVAACHMQARCAAAASYLQMGQGPIS